MTIHEHPESFEVRDGEGKPVKYFYFEDEPTRRSVMERMSREQALQAARAFVGEWNCERSKLNRQCHSTLSALHARNSTLLHFALKRNRKMAIDQKAFFAESKRLQEEFGLTRDQADHLAAIKFWEGIVDEKMQPTEGEIVSRRPADRSPHDLVQPTMPVNSGPTPFYIKIK